MGFRVIVVGVDGSEDAQRALAEAAELATASDATIHLVCAVHFPSAHEVAQVLEDMPEEFRGAYDAAAAERQTLDEAARYLVAKGVNHQQNLVEGNAAEVILDEAERVDADLVVVGSRGLGRATRFIRGSVSHRIANHADRSVLIVK